MGRNRNRKLFFLSLDSLIRVDEKYVYFQMTTVPSQVQVTITRKSDDSSVVLLVNQKTTIAELKTEIRTRLPPQFDQACRLIYKGKVLRSKRTLKHYGLTNNQAPPNVLGNSNIIMDDTKNWKSDSSSSSSEQSD
jgi:hypothetical protein